MASASRFAKKKLDDILQCSVCATTFSDPRALPCLHTFCFRCIDEKCKDKQPGENAECPLCRKEFAIPEIGIANLQKSHFIRNLLSIDVLKKSQTTLKLCDVCANVEEASQKSDSVAKEFCLECQQNLCKACSVIHAKLKSSSLHKMLNLDKISEDIDIFKQQSLLCDKHADRQIEAFCFECKTTLCMVCYIKDHSSHKISDLVEVVGDFCSELKQDIQNMNAAISKLDKNLQVIHLRKLSFIEKIKKVEASIIDRAEQLNNMIETEKQKLLAELFDIKGIHEKELENLVLELTQDKSLLKNYKKYCTELLQKGTNADITREASELHLRSEELGNVKNVEEALKNASVGYAIFLPSGVTNNETNSILGQVVKKGAKPGIPASTHILTGNPITGLALLDEDLFVTRLNEQHVSVFNSGSMQLKRQIAIPGFGTYTWGMAACSMNMYLYVSDYQQHCVHRINLGAADANTPVATWNVSASPAGLSINRKSNVLVGYQNDKKIQEYTPNGRLVREVSDGINTLWQAVELNNDTLVVYRTGPIHGISTMSTCGRVLRCYGYNQPAGGAIAVPQANRNFAIDSEGNLIVADQQKHAILIINSSLTDDRPLEIPANIGLQSPSGLCYDQSRGLLYVAEYGGQNRLFAFSNVTNLGSMFNC